MWQFWMLKGSDAAYSGLVAMTDGIMDTLPKAAQGVSTNGRMVIKDRIYNPVEHTLQHNNNWKVTANDFSRQGFY